MGAALYSWNWENVYTNKDTNIATSLFHAVIYELYDKYFPLVEKKINRSNPMWFTEDLVLLFKLRNEAFSSGDMDVYGDFNVRIKKSLKKEQEKWFDDLISSHEIGSSNFYDQIRKLLGFESSRFLYKFPGKSNQDSFMEIFNFFKDMANKHPPLNLEDYQLSSTSEGIPLMTKYEVYNFLSKVSSKGSQSPDNIPNFIWKEFAIELTDPITSLINLSLLSGSCPSLWKTASLVCIPKVAVPLGAHQLRPISITSPLSKLCERHVFDLIMPKLLPKLDPFQFGGMPGKSAAQYLSIYVHTILEQLESGSKSVFSIITDFHKAFDNLDHNIFVSRLMAMLVSQPILKWICSFISNRTQILRNTYDSTTYSYECNNGVPQGSVLGCLVFAVLVDDLARKYSMHLKYVDDLTVSGVLTSVNCDINLPQVIFDDLASQTESIGLQLNFEKCFLIVHSFLRIGPVLAVHINDLQLKVVNHIKILGVIIQHDMKWNLQVEHLIKKANGLIFILYKLKRLGANFQILKIAYISYIRSNIEYCAPVWGPSLTKSQCEALEMIQKRSVRIIMGNSYVNYDHALIYLNLKSLNDRRIDLSLKFARSFFLAFLGFLPPLQGSVSGIQTRGAMRHVVPRAKTKRFMNSPIINAINMINSELI